MLDQGVGAVLEEHQARRAGKRGFPAADRGADGVLVNVLVRVGNDVHRAGGVDRSAAQQRVGFPAVVGQREHRRRREFAFPRGQRDIDVVQVAGVLRLQVEIAGIRVHLAGNGGVHLVLQHLDADARIQCQLSVVVQRCAHVHAQLVHGIVVVRDHVHVLVCVHVVRGCPDVFGCCQHEQRRADAVAVGHVQSAGHSPLQAVADGFHGHVSAGRGLFNIVHRVQRSFARLRVNRVAVGGNHRVAGKSLVGGGDNYACGNRVDMVVALRAHQDVSALCRHGACAHIGLDGVLLDNEHRRGAGSRAVFIARVGQVDTDRHLSGHRDAPVFQMGGKGRCAAGSDAGLTDGALHLVFAHQDRQVSACGLCLAGGYSQRRDHGQVVAFGGNADVLPCCDLVSFTALDVNSAFPSEEVEVHVHTDGGIVPARGAQGRVRGLGLRIAGNFHAALRGDDSFFVSAFLQQDLGFRP